MTQPVPSTAVSTLLDGTAAHHNATAMITPEETITFAELRERARHLAVGLQDHGVRPGDHIGVWMHNSVDLAVVVYAAAYAKAVLVPMNTWHRAREMTHAVHHSEIALLIVGDEIAGRSGADAVRDWYTAPSEFPHLRTLVFAAEPVAGGLRLTDLEPARDPDQVERGIDEPAYMLFTSGTTGAAKGVLLDDAAVTADARLLGERLGLAPGDRYYCPVPLFHAGGLIFVLFAAHARGAAVVTRRRFDPAEALDDIEQHRCRVTGGFEVIYSRLVDAAEARGGAPSTLAAGWWVGTAGAFLRTEAALGLRLSNLYGMTEASGNVSSTPLVWDAEVRAHHQGRPLPGRTVVAVDPVTGEDLPAGQVGELRVGGWGVMHGYWRQPDATAAKLDDRGRLRSGDAGLVDEHGNVHFLGRIDDALKIGGENVAPLEVEEVLSEHADVDEAVVVGVPDERYGHQLVAFVRLRAGASVDGDALRAHVRTNLAAFKVPRRVEFLPDFPRTSTGKVRKTELIAHLTGATAHPRP